MNKRFVQRDWSWDKFVLLGARTNFTAIKYRLLHTSSESAEQSVCKKILLRSLDKLDASIKEVLEANDLYAASMGIKLPASTLEDTEKGPQS